MKKNILIFALAFVLCILVACGSGNENEKTTETDINTETEAGGEESVSEEEKPEQPIRLSEEEKAKFYKVVEFDVPEGDFRDVLVDTMRKYASIEWTAAEDFVMSQDNGDWTVGLQYKKGVKYHGLPYTSYSVSYDYFANEIVDGKYVPKNTDWNSAPGVNCFSSIFVSYQSFEPAEGGPYYWLPGHADFCLEIVGDYKLPSKPETTTQILELNGKDAMIEAYSQMKKGDIIYTLKNRSTGNLHCRVLTEDPTIFKTAAGKIIPSRSYVTTIEQTNAFDKSRTDGVNTTWYVDHVYAFENLFSSGYVPMTLPAYSKSLSEIEVPYVALDTEITPSVLAKGTFSSSVKTNYSLRTVRAEIFDKDGNVVASYEKGDILRVVSMPLRNSFSFIFDNLENGDYTFVLTAGISVGNAELARVDFTYNK